MTVTIPTNTLLTVLVLTVAMLTVLTLTATTMTNYIADCAAADCADADYAGADCAAYPDATPAGNRNDPSASWNPFSTGPRNCIGQALALAELRTVLAVLLANFFFQLPEGVQRERFVEEEEVWWVTLQAKHGVHLKVTPVMGEEKKKSGFVPKSTFYSQELLRLVKEAEEDGASGKQ